MPLVDIIWLALVQALTEFLPVSSSAHLYIASRFTEAHRYQGIVFDMGLHLGTLVAVLLYFRKEWWALLTAGLRYRGGLLNTEQLQLASLAVASIPAAAFGLFLSKMQLVEVLRNDVLIGCTLISFGLLLWFAERFQQQPNAAVKDQFGFKDTVLVGVAQALALIPGVSRSGITMTAAMLLGMRREAAARLSFLMAVPATGLAVGKGLLELSADQTGARATDFFLGSGFSFVLGLIVIHFFMGLIRKIGVLPFTLYRVLLGTALLLAWI